MPRGVGFLARFYRPRGVGVLNTFFAREVVNSPIKKFAPGVLPGGRMVRLGTD